MKKLMLVGVWIAAVAGMTAFAAPSIKLRLEANPKEITIGDPIEYKLTVITSSNVAMAPLNVPQPWGEFEILEIRPLESGTSKEGETILTQTIYLTTFSTGSLTLAALPLNFAVPNGPQTSAQTEEIKITVKSLLEAEGDIGNMKPLKGLFNFRSYLWLWILLGILVVGGLLYGLWKWRSQKLKVNGTPVGPPKPAEETAWDALHKLESSDLLSQGHIKEFYSRLSFIIRQYLEDRYGFSALERTTNELLLEFRHRNLPMHVVNLLRDFFETGDLVKFAKWTPTEEDIDGDVTHVKEILTVTTPVKNLEEREKIPV